MTTFDIEILVTFWGNIFWVYVLTKNFHFDPYHLPFFPSKLQLYRAVTAQFILWLFKKTRLGLPHLPVQIFMTCQFGCKNACFALKVILRFFSSIFKPFCWRLTYDLGQYRSKFHLCRVTPYIYFAALGFYHWVAFVI